MIARVSQLVRLHGPRTSWAVGGLSLVVLVASVTIGVVASAGDGSTDPKSTGVPPLVVRTALVEFQPSYTIDRQFAGQVEAARESELSFERGGKVIAVSVEEGQHVAEGERLASLDTEQLESQRGVLAARLEADRAMLRELENGPRKEDIEAARADVQRIEAQVRLDRIEAKRASELYGNRASPEAERDRSVLGLAVSEAQLRAANANLAELLAGTRPEQIEAQRASVRRTEAEITSLDVDIRKSQLVAPFAGVVGRRFLDEGRVIAAGEPVLELLEMGRLEARVGVAGPAAESLYVGQDHRLRWRDLELSASVKAIRPDRQSVTRAVGVLLTVNDPPANVRSGDVVALALGKSIEERGAWLPIGALTEGVRGLWVCYAAVLLEVPDANGATHRLEPRDLEIVHHAGDRAYVRGPIGAEDRVVVSGLQRVTAGLRVRVEP